MSAGSSAFMAPSMAAWRCFGARAASIAALFFFTEVPNQWNVMGGAILRFGYVSLAVLGALKARCVVSPLFSAFGPEPIATRCEMGDARVLVTTPELYQRKVKGLRARGGFEVDVAWQDGKLSRAAIRSKPTPSAGCFRSRSAGWRVV